MLTTIKKRFKNCYFELRFKYNKQKYVAGEQFIDEMLRRGYTLEQLKFYLNNRPQDAKDFFKMGAFSRITKIERTK